jgi:hypothetical protein
LVHLGQQTFTFAPERFLSACIRCETASRLRLQVGEGRLFASEYGLERFEKTFTMLRSQLENDAPCIIRLHRPWDDVECRLVSLGELIVAKNRNGETGSIQVKYSRSTLTFDQVGSFAGAVKAS